MGKEKNDKAYGEGYKEGKNGNFRTDFSQSIKNVVPLPNSESDDSYDAGYDAGANDRYSGGSDSSSSDSSSSSSDSDCFITTATIRNMDKPDDCIELTMFREYRDQWLVKQDRGEQLIEEYYSIAPPIVKNINAKNNASDIYENIWNIYLQTCYEYIGTSRNEEAKKLYIQMVDDLKIRFLT